MAKHKRIQNQGSYNRQMSRMTMKPSQAVGPRPSEPQTLPFKACYYQGKVYATDGSSWNYSTLVKDEGGSVVVSFPGKDFPGMYRVRKCSPADMAKISPQAKSGLKTATKKPSLARRRRRR